MFGQIAETLLPAERWLGTLILPDSRVR